MNAVVVDSEPGGDYKKWRHNLALTNFGTTYRMISVLGYNIALEVDLVNIILAVIALLALAYAKYQISIARKDSLTQINILETQAVSVRAQMLEARARILLDLDMRWESQSMLATRTALLKTVQEVKNEIDTAWAHVSEREKREKRGEAYAECLKKLHDTNLEAYGKFMEICGFFETVGYMAKHDYIPTNDIIELYGGALRLAGEIFGIHVRKRREDERDERLFEYFMYLVDAVGRS